MNINERYKMVCKEIDRDFDGKTVANVKYETVVKEIDEYFKNKDI